MRSPVRASAPSNRSGVELALSSAPATLIVALSASSSSSARRSLAGLPCTEAFRRRSPSRRVPGTSSLTPRSENSSPASRLAAVPETLPSSVPTPAAVALEAARGFSTAGKRRTSRSKRKGLAEAFRSKVWFEKSLTVPRTSRVSSSRWKSRDLSVASEVVKSPSSRSASGVPLGLSSWPGRKISAADRSSSAWIDWRAESPFACAWRLSGPESREPKGSEAPSGGK